MKIGPTQTATPVARKKQLSKYKAAIDRVLALKPGQQFEVDPEGLKGDEAVQSFRNRLSSALRHAIGSKFQVRLIRTEKDAICVQRRDAKDDIYFARARTKKKAKPTTKSRAKTTKAKAKRPAAKTKKPVAKTKARKPLVKKPAAKKRVARKAV